MEKEYVISEAWRCVYKNKEEKDEGGGFEKHTVKPAKLATLLILPPVTAGHIFVEPVNPDIILHFHYFIFGHLCISNLSHIFTSNATAFTPLQPPYAMRHKQPVTVIFCRTLYGPKS